ncbi:MAG: hydroxyethylthiazole kinase [Deltaproteobacteria bacterium]|nr:hydroxyethylthiazole kinase [Deltaproteobacteria bacterium]
MLEYNLGLLLEQVRKRRPLVHCISNPVVLNFTANVLLAMGASPIMAHNMKEVEEIVSAAGALVLNLGMPSEKRGESMILAGKAANRRAIPVVLDPVGTGLTHLRSELVLRITEEVELAVICGNASEILALAGTSDKPRGVEAAHAVEEAIAVGRQIAEKLPAVIAITGPIDLITDGNSVVRCRNGHPLLASIAGSGCAASAIIAAFAAVHGNPLEAAAAGLAFLGLAGERAGEEADAPGSFMAGLLDALSRLSPEEFDAGARLQGLQ